MKDITDVAAVVISFVALIVSLLSFLHSRRADRVASSIQIKGLDLQKAEIRRQFGEKLQELSHLLTQDQLVAQRSDSLIRSFDLLIIAPPAELAKGPTFYALRNSFDDLRRSVKLVSSVHEEAKTVLNRAWDLNTVTPEVFKNVQAMCASLKSGLAKKEPLAEEAEQRFASFSASAQALSGREHR